MDDGLDCCARCDERDCDCVCDITNLAEIEAAWEQGVVIEPEYRGTDSEA